MGFLNQITKNVPLNGPPLRKKHAYTIRLYSGGIPIEAWEDHPPEDQKKALAKSWYIKYWYRDPATGRLVRQPNIKAGINRYPTKAQRLEFFEIYRQAMEKTFAQGFTPFSPDGPGADPLLEGKRYSISEALELALEVKRSTVRIDTFKDYQRAADRFVKWIRSREGHGIRIDQISRRHVSHYLDHVLKKTSPRTRNNTRSSLSALFSILRDRFIIDRNFIDTDIPKIREVKKTEKQIPQKALQDLFFKLAQADPLLLLFIKMISFNFLRPVEICRLTLEDINLDQNLIYFDQKTKLGKTKRIPSIYKSELQDLITLGSDPGDLLFTPSGIPGPWPVPVRGRRDYFSKRLAKFRRAHRIAQSVTLYSFRHTFITAAYRSLINQGKSEAQAIDTLLPITGHHSREGLSNYLGRYDAALPGDWSELFNEIV